VAHNPAFAKKAGVPMSVGKDFSAADKGRKFSKGGDMEKLNMVNKGGKMVPSFAADGKGKMANGGITTAKMGAVKSGGNKGKGEHAIQSKGLSKGTMVKMSGSKPLGMKRGGKTC